MDIYPNTGCRWMPSIRNLIGSRLQAFSSADHSVAILGCLAHGPSQKLYRSRWRRHISLFHRSVELANDEPRFPPVLYRPSLRSVFGHLRDSGARPPAVMAARDVWAGVVSKIAQHGAETSVPVPAVWDDVLRTAFTRPFMCFVRANLSIRRSLLIPDGDAVASATTVLRAERSNPSAHLL